MLKKLYEKDQTWFAILFIIIYAAGASVADQLSKKIGVEKSITILFCTLLVLVLYDFIKKNNILLNKITVAMYRNSQCYECTERFCK